jgi:hypothetical protein
LGEDGIGREVYLNSVKNVVSWVTEHITHDVGDKKLYRILVGKHPGRQKIFVVTLRWMTGNIDHMDGTCKMVEVGIFCDKVPDSAIYQQVSYCTNH